MDLVAFEELLDRHGGDLAIWPREERGAALALLDTSAEARAALADMQLVEATLRADRPAPASGGVVAARAMRQPQQRPTRPGPRRAGWAVAASCVLALGFYLGGSAVNRDEGPEHVVAAALETSGSIDVD